ncbi:MAG: universal stress protein [Nakamurella multipartita]
MGIERQATITVGVDGSPESMVAATWAAQEAARRRMTLELLLSINEPLENHSGYVFPAPVIEAVRSANRERLADVAAVVRREHPDIQVRTSLDFVDPRRALVTRSRHTSMTVVGTRGHGRLPEVLVGSVALYVAAHAHSPVAVVPPAADLTAAGPGGPVVVAVDGRPDSISAIGFAFDEAAVHHTELVAVLVFDELAYRGFAKGGSQIGHLEDDEERAVLARELAGWAEKYPDVPVRQLVLRGQPAQTLLHYAAGSPAAQRPRLLVVGSRGRGGMAGLLLGSTSQRLVTQATVPVIVVRPEPG